MHGGFEVKLFDCVKAPIGIASVGLVGPVNAVESQGGHEIVYCQLTLPRMARGLYRLTVQLTQPRVRIIDSTGDGVVFEVHPEPFDECERSIKQDCGWGVLEIPMEFVRSEVQYLA